MTSSEIVEVVDENDRVLSLASLDDCKRKGLLHRTACVFVRNRADQVLLQRRSLSDDWLPGKWTVSCSGHIKAREPPEQAAVRELKEELGIEENPRFLFKKLLPSISWSEFSEFEVAYAFESVTDQKVRINRDEVEEVKFVAKDEFYDMIQKNTEEFTPDAIILLQKYLQKAASALGERNGPTNPVE